MLSIYKKEFGENNDNGDPSASGTPDTLLPSGISVAILSVCILCSLKLILNNTFHPLGVLCIYTMHFVIAILHYCPHNAHTSFSFTIHFLVFTDNLLNPVGCVAIH